MFTSTRGCAEPMLPFCRLKDKVTLEGKTLTQKIFVNFNMYLNIYETNKNVFARNLKNIYEVSQLGYAGQVS